MAHTFLTCERCWLSTSFRSCRLMADGAQPAVWVVNPAYNTAALKHVTIGSYEASAVLIKSGLEPGDRAVVDGGKLLSSGELVTYDEDRS